MFCPLSLFSPDVPPINPTLPEIAFPATSIVFAIILSAFNVPVVIRPPAIDVIPPLVSLPTLLSATNILPADIMVPFTDPVLPATSVTISPCELRCVIKALSEVCPVSPCDSVVFQRCLFLILLYLMQLNYQHRLLYLNLCYLELLNRPSHLHRLKYTKSDAVIVTVPVFPFTDCTVAPADVIKLLSFVKLPIVIPPEPDNFSLFAVIVPVSILPPSIVVIAVPPSLSSSTKSNDTREV